MFEEYGHAQTMACENYNMDFLTGSSLPANHGKDIKKVEAVQRRAARWAIRDYKFTSSVTAMLKDLKWRPLDL